MEIQEYIELIKETYEEVMDDFKTSKSKEEFGNIFLDTARALIDTKDEDYNTSFEAITADYIKSVRAISKLSPGLATGLHDEIENITLNTYNGKMSDIPNDAEITKNTVFDASSMTKMFTAILLLKEAEKGNIDLNKKFSDYNPILSQIKVRIIDALRFGVNLRTNGRLDEPGITAEERKHRLESTYVVEEDTFIYSDIPYMLVPLLFGKTMEEATENYIKKFYELYRDEVGLSKTGYSLIGMTGGTVKVKFENETSYEKDGIYDPKAKIFEREVGYISGHAGVTTTVTDLQKLFSALSHGLLNKHSLKELITPTQPDSKVLHDKNGKPVLKNDMPVIINRGIGVYINTGDIRESDISTRYSDTAFAAAGSTGTYSAFDIENGFNATNLSNVRSGLFRKWINTDDYTYGDDIDAMPKHYETTLVSGTGTIRDGRIFRPDGSFMTYVRATNNFKEESLETMLKLRIAKRALIKRTKLLYSDDELENAIKKIEDIFSGKFIQKQNDKTY